MGGGAKCNKGDIRERYEITVMDLRESRRGAKLYKKPIFFAEDVSIA